MSEGSTRSRAADYAAIALVSCAALLLQVAFTRLSSVVLWYHFAFLTVSLAMLGVGAPGVWFTLKPPSDAALRRSLLAAGVSIPLALIGIVKLGALLPNVPGTLDKLAYVVPARVVLTVACTLVPLLALGVSTVLLLLRATGPAFGRMYAADLAGAALGAAVAVPLMRVIPTPTLIALCGLLPMAASVLLLRAIPKSIAVAAIGLALMTVWGEPFRLRYTKTYAESDVIWERWTPTARLAVFPTPFFRVRPDQAFGWGMGTRFEPFPLEQYWLEQDGSAGTPITRLDRPPAQLPHLLFDVTSVGYQLRPPASACVIGAGGGRDILTALAAGATRVDAVEVNGAIIRALEGRFREFSGDVYRLPGVRAYAEEGRSFLTHSDRRWDSIQISLIDSWAATAAGAFALSENHLYTVEAMRLYLSRLTPHGVVSISRYSQGNTGLEAPRLALLVRRALELEGVSDANAHIVVAEGDAVATVVASLDPMGPGDVRRLDAVCAERGFVRQWPVDPSPHRRLTMIAEALANGPRAHEALGFDLSPPTDDRPFFFHLAPVFGRIDPRVYDLRSFNDGAAVLLRRLILLVGAVTVALFVSPFAAPRRLPRGPGLWRGSTYFAAIGVGFLLVEAALIQKLILYLGHPSYATTVVLAGMLAGAGLGSWSASVVRDRVVNRWRFALPGAVLVAALALPVVVGRTLGWPLGGRIAVSFAVVVPLAVAMGFAFPIGMSRLGEERKAWYWAINGATGVLAGVLSLALAMTFGYAAVLGVGACAYLVAAAALPTRRA